MNKNKIEQHIIDSLKALLETDRVEPEQSLEELQVDSIIFIRLIVQCEAQFGIQFEDKMLLVSCYPNVQALINYALERYNEIGGE